MARRGSFAKLLVAPLVALVAVTGCRLKSQSAPDPTGPSEFGLSLAMTATPDTITRDGSKSTIAITARNEAGQPRSNVEMRLDATCISRFGNQLLASDVGGLSSSLVATGSDGRAMVMYTAPTEDEFLTSYCGNDIFINATPIGDNYANASMRRVQLHLIKDPVAPVAAFTFVPLNPRTGEVITFDASTSHAEPGRRIVSYAWQFGTDRTGSGKVVTKQYDTPNIYKVTLTVTDDYGRKGQIARDVTVEAPPTEEGGQ